MWPWGHAAVGYLLWSAFVNRADDRPPTGPEVAFVGLGTQFPDLVDKPLAWTFGILPSGRSLAHSLLTAALVISIVYLVTRRREEPVAVAFGIGYVSHSVADSFSPLLTGEYDKLTYLLWPVLPSPVYESESLASNVDGLALSGFVLVELLLVAFALVRWRFDGMPGIAEFVSRLRAVR
ncbi:metal-dependent hydrolase [Halopelagius fulvigenes]|uniref:Metal-dependent hydrolase n=1 Tax=Halopelagius fulvigenes TaxID=1198324 RepID=A0ABD5TWW9_9EURY